MTIKEAINVFNKSEYRNNKVVAYTSYKGFIILITEDNGYIGSNYYIVLDNKHIMPTNPMIINLNESQIKRL